MMLEADEIYQGTSQVSLGTGPGVDTPLHAFYYTGSNIWRILFIKPHIFTVIV